MRKVEFRGSVPAFTQRESEKPFWKKKLSTLDQDLIPDLLVIGSLVQNENYTLDRADIEAGDFEPQGLWSPSLGGGHLFILYPKKFPPNFLWPSLPPQTHLWNLWGYGAHLRRISEGVLPSTGYDLLTNVWESGQMLDWLFIATERFMRSNPPSFSEYFINVTHSLLSVLLTHTVKPATHGAVNIVVPDHGTEGCALIGSPPEPAVNQARKISRDLSRKTSSLSISDIIFQQRAISTPSKRSSNESCTVCGGLKMDASSIIQEHVLKAAVAVEEQLDAELKKLDNLDEDGLEELREQRLRDLKKQAQLKQEWLANGHGEYTELPDEKDFFEASKKSTNIVCHFYKSDSARCKIVDHHLKILSHSHLETRFVKLDVERCPFLTERLRIKIIPTIALISDSKTKDFIVGFTDLGNCDDFSTEILEWRIARSGAIKYNGNLLEPPEQKKKKTNLLSGGRKKNIRGHDSDDSSDGDEL
uniref:Thioredoxin domain-containing protein 9 n=2 Tax=Timema TaxID=61471 RepID=A0A7R9F293_9NEOP|nr:unnamed protein product [Timema bartmani]